MRISTTGLSILYYTSNDIRKFVDGLASLAFFHPERVGVIFIVLRSRVNFPTQLNQLYD